MSVAGIGCDPAQPGFKQIVIRPRPGGGLTEAQAQFRSIHGLITSAWKVGGGTLTLSTRIPANTTATVHVPAKEAAGVTESGKPAASAAGVKFLRMEDGAAVFAVGSGSYQFQSALP